MKPEVKKQIILNAPYLLFVYLFDKLGEVVRLTSGADGRQPKATAHRRGLYRRLFELVTQLWPVSAGFPSMCPAFSASGPE